MTFAILNLSGKMPVARDLLNICVRGIAISGPIFFKRQEERPVMSGVRLFSNDLMQERISSIVMGDE